VADTVVPRLLDPVLLGLLHLDGLGS
jgi:hypothetical protein